jgi:hypothetical protein
MMLKRIIVQYIVGCIFGLMGFICFTMITAMLQRTFLTEVFPFGGDKSVVFSGLMLGIPIGALVGLTVINRYVFRAREWNALGLVLGFVLTQVGIVFTLCLMDFFGSKAGVLLGLFATVCLILIGYNIRSIFSKVRRLFEK